MQISILASSAPAAGSAGSSQEVVSTQATLPAPHFPLRTPSTGAVSATHAGCVGSPSPAKVLDACHLLGLEMTQDSQAVSDGAE
eukprot:3715845-Pyramimonas_sp.AAC.1